jgi:hypothetical protein
VVLQPGAYEPVLIAVLLVEVAAMLRTIGFCAASLLVIHASARCGEGLPAVDIATEAASERIASLIERLDGREFAERQAASQQLEEAGAVAIPQLELTATAGSREASGRALDVLKRHFERGTDEVKLAAREVLVRLAESDNPSTAQRARDVLNPRKALGIVSPVGIQPPIPPPPVNNFGGGFNFGGRGGINVNAGPFRRISIADINGRRVIEIDERERRVKMETGPGGSIDVEVTDKQNGRNRRLDARDLNELKRKDGELGRLYEQYAAPWQRQRGPIGPAAPPFGFVPPAPIPATPAESAKRQLEIIDALLERTRQRLPNDPAAQRMIDALEEAKQGYKETPPAQEAARIVR